MTRTWGGYPHSGSESRHSRTDLWQHHRVILCDTLGGASLLPPTHSRQRDAGDTEIVTSGHLSRDNTRIVTSCFRIVLQPQQTPMWCVTNINSRIYIKYQSMHLYWGTCPGHGCNYTNFVWSCDSRYMSISICHEMSQVLQRNENIFTGRWRQNFHKAKFYSSCVLKLLIMGISLV